jgi:hypothetical protein
VIEHWDGTSWSVVASPNPTTRGNSFLSGIAAVSATDIWAVGGATGFGPVTEHWNGTSWTILATPSGVSLDGVTALGDGTVVAVGAGSNNSAVILSNVPLGSASASAATGPAVHSSAGVAGSLTTAAAVPNASAVATPGTGTAGRAWTRLAVPDTALADQFFVSGLPNG